MKFGGEVEHDSTHVPAQFQVPPLLRLPVPSLRKRPRGKTEVAAAAEAEKADESRGPRRKRSGGTGRGRRGIGEPIEGMMGGS